MSKFRLTPEQLRFMDTFGYLHFPGFLNDCIDQIVEAFEQVWVDLNVDHPETQRTYIVPFIGQSEYLSSLLDDDRIDGLRARQDRHVIGRGDRAVLGRGHGLGKLSRYRARRLGRMGAADDQRRQVDGRISA